MKNILGFLVLGGFILVIFRVFLQINAILLLKKYKNIFLDLGIDKWLLLIPEIAFLLSFKNKISVDNKKELKKVGRYFIVLRIYKIYLILYFVLFILSFISK